MIVPFPAGGGTDAFARPLSAQFTKRRPDAGHRQPRRRRRHAGRKHRGQAPADGYTLFMGAVHHAIAPSMYPKLDYDIEKDFVPLMLLANVPQVVVVNPKRVHANDHPGIHRAGEAQPGQVQLRLGRLGHLAPPGGRAVQAADRHLHHPHSVPRRRPGAADLISGNVDLMFDGLGSSAQHIKGGRIKALMVAGSKRNPAFPDVPCAAEVGLPDYTVTTWYGLWAPKGTPADVQARAIDDMKKALATDDLKTIWAQNGSEIPNVTGAAYGSFVNCRDQALGHGGEGIGRQARMTAGMAGVRLRRDGAIAEVTLSHAGRLNAMSRAMWRAAAQRVRRAFARPTRACAASSCAARAGRSARVATFPSTRRSVSKSPACASSTRTKSGSRCRPCSIAAAVVAQIEGACMGAGIEIASCCDIRLAGASAKFGAPIAKLGFPMAPREAALVHRAIGDVLARDMLLAAGVHGAQRLYDAGFLLHVLPDDAKWPPPCRPTHARGRAGTAGRAPATSRPLPHCGPAHRRPARCWPPPTTTPIPPNTAKASPPSLPSATEFLKIPP
jgi:tripartite-type tricarboxylate transporter receptor subunit TctC/enoyl-CoA hydratase/carnithine racemase